MARRSSNESTSDLYIRLGLSLDELESGFVDAERTIRDNMARLSRSNRIIELQMQVDLSGLDEAADAEQIMQIRTEALNRQIAGQKDRVRLANAELRNMAERHGENSDQAQRARLQLEHERVALARLEEQLNSLNETQDDANEGATTFMDRISDLAGRFAPYIAAIGSAIAATQELIDKYAELQKQAYELNMPFQKTKELLRQIKFAGGDIGDFEGFIRGITDAYVKGEVDDPEFIALSKYGAKITDATGRLKDFKDITEEVYQAYLKAKDAGEEIEFLQLVGGESGVRDAIQFFERYAEAKEDAAKVFDSGVDPKQMHEASRALNLVTEQFGELKDAIVSIITPAVTAGLQRFFAVLHEGTRFVVENKEVLTLLSTPTLGPIDLAEKLIGLRAHLLGLPSALKETAVSWADFKRIINDDVPQKDNNPLSQYAQKRISDFQAELEELRIELDFADNEYQQAIAKLNLWRRNETNDKLHLSDDERLAVEELYNAKLDKINQERADKLEEIREQVAQGDRNALEKKLATIEKEKEAWRSAGMEESEIIELAEKKRQQAIEESLKKTQELIQKTSSIAYDLTHDDLEKQIYDIERWKEAQFSKAETAEQVSAIIEHTIMREAEMFEKEIDRIKKRTESVQDTLARLTLSSREYDRWSAKKEYKKNIDEGVDPELADRLYNARLRKSDLSALDDKDGKYLRSRMPATSKDLELINADSSSLALNKVVQTVQQSTESSSQTVQSALEIIKQLAEQSKKTNDEKIESFEVLYGDTMQDFTTHFDALNQSAETATPNIKSLGESALNAGQSFSDLIEKLSQMSSNIQATATGSGNVQQADNGTDIVGKVLEGTSVAGEVAAIAGVATMQPHVALIGAAVQTIADVALFIKDNLPDSEAEQQVVNTSVQSMSKDVTGQLSSISKTLNDIYQKMNTAPQQNITVSPTNNINLGGAYVFDDAMKTQLTNDITTNVVNAVTDAVQKATTQTNYGYAR